MVESYEQLSGAVGRKVFFRAQRYPARKLLEHLRPILHLDRRPYLIHDLSMNGVSCYGPAGDFELEVGASAPVSIELDGWLVYEGEGVISRIQATPKGQKVALRITKGFLDIPMIMATHDELVLRHELEGGVEKDLSLVRGEYRQLCSEVFYLMRRYRSMLDRYERHLERSSATTLLPPGFIQECEERFRFEWIQLRAKAENYISTIMQNADTVRATKRFTECLVTPELLDAPLWRRCYEKPLDYPGDYEVMNILYTNTRLGDSAFARMVHQIGLEHPYAVSVRYRKDMIRDVIAECVATTPADKHPVRITSLGCGPAREVQEYLDNTMPSKPVHFTFIDQDDRALSFAYSRVYPHVIHSAGRVSVECLHLSFTQLLREPEVMQPRAAQHLIYVSGLFDYLPQDAAYTLSAELFTRLAPGGLLVLGNFGTLGGGYWEMEFVVDWPLVRRTQKELLGLADGLGAGSVDLRSDPTGLIHLLFARRP